MEIKKKSFIKKICMINIRIKINRDLQGRIKTLLFQRIKNLDRSKCNYRNSNLGYQ
jgi:hypothetical protein